MPVLTVDRSCGSQRPARPQGERKVRVPEALAPGLDPPFSPLRLCQTQSRGRVRLCPAWAESGNPQKSQERAGLHVHHKTP